MKNYRRYTDEEIIKYSKESISMAQLLIKLGLKTAGGNYASMKKKLQQLNIDTSHWKGQAWSKDEQLKDWSAYIRCEHIKPHLIKKRGHKCEKCGLSMWLNENIPLEMHHKDGDRTNNTEENLELICCNCHSFSDTWRGRIKK